jgi:hypothetical protein
VAAVAGTLVLSWRAPRVGYSAVLFFPVFAPSSSFLPIATEVAAGGSPGLSEQLTRYREAVAD